MDLEESSAEEEGDTRDADSLMPPRYHRPSLDSDKQPYERMGVVNNVEIERLQHLLSKIDFAIQKEIEAVEHYDITIQIITFKIYEATREFKARIGEVKDERNKILISIENQSELSLVLNDLDKKISALEHELNDKIAQLNQQKLEFQEKTESVIAKLEEDVPQMAAYQLTATKELKMATDSTFKAQTLLINQKYGPILEKYHQRLFEYEKLQLSGWRILTSEARLSEMLEHHGLKFTPSARLITRAGALITFQEAKDLGYLDEVSTSLDKVLEFLNERTLQQRALDNLGPPSRTSGESTKEGSARSQMSSEDVSYLKQFVGKPLTLALSEITVKQPRDPIHYLGHYLFKYRYNQDLEEVQKREVEDLSEQRKILARERWKKFVEAEAKDAVLEMILRAEKMIYQNELKRIADEQMLAAEGEERVEDAAMDALMEEARDKFE